MADPIHVPPSLADRLAAIEQQMGRLYSPNLPPGIAAEAIGDLAACVRDLADFVERQMFDIAAVAARVKRLDELLAGLVLMHGSAELARQAWEQLPAAERERLEQRARELVGPAGPMPPLKSRQAEPP